MWKKFTHPGLCADQSKTHFGLNPRGGPMASRPGKIIVHVGLPKTATTTLQEDVFPKLVSDCFIYLGIVHPRNEARQHFLFEPIYKAIATGELVSGLHRQISKELSFGKTILLSEEMITASEGPYSWRAKLRNLKSLVDQYDYEIIVTVREPVSALFSYYCELFPRLSNGKNGFVDCALGRDEFEIYHYGKLIDVLLECFERKRIHIIRFEDIINNHIGALLAVVAPVHADLSKFSINNRNRKVKGAQFVEIKYDLSMLDVLDRLLDRKPLWNGKAILFLKRLLPKSMKQLDKIKLHRRVQVRRPSPEDESLIRLSLRLETERLNKEFGINYE